MVFYCREEGTNLVQFGHFLDGIKKEVVDGIKKEVVEEEEDFNEEKSDSECGDLLKVELDYESPDEDIDTDYDWELESSDFYTGRDKITNWSKTPVPNLEKITPHKIAPQPLGSAIGITDEKEAFEKIIDSEMMDIIVENTNININTERRKHNRERDANNTTKEEILSLLGILYLMGTLKAKDINVTEFWQSDGTGIEILRATMSYKRYYFLLKSLRFDDKHTRKSRSDFDKLAQIRPILDPFVNNCKNSYYLSELVTFGELLVPFRGKCSFNRYVPNKAARYGIKLSVLCDVRSHYIGNLEVFCGTQNRRGPYHVSNHPTDVVSRITSYIESSGRNVTAEKRFATYHLANVLLQKKLTFIGPLKTKHAEVPPCFLPPRNNILENTVYGFQKDVTLLSYVPERGQTILLLSTKHNDASCDDNGKPRIFLDFQTTKSAVDLVEELCGAHTCSRRSGRWSLALFMTLMNIAGINAHVLYCANEANKKVERRAFLKSLALKMMQPHLSERAKLKTLPMDIQGFLSRYKSTEPEVYEMELELRKGKKRGRCKPCGRAKDVNTTMKCGKCYGFVCKRHSFVICESCHSKL